PVDGFVSVDGEGYSGLDLSFMASDVHALQWYETEGEIERKDIRGRIISNEAITDLTPYQPALDAWQVAKNAAAVVPTEPTPLEEQP
nr:hypothetical protein [bacterium]